MTTLKKILIVFAAIAVYLLLIDFAEDIGSKKASGINVDEKYGVDYDPMEGRY